MNKIKMAAQQLRSSALLLPQLMHKPKLLEIWMRQSHKAQITLGIILFLLLVAAGPVSQGLADYWYPLERETLGERISILFNSSAYRQAEQLHDSRYQQINIGLWCIGLGTVLLVLLLELPRALTIGNRQAQQLLEQASNIKHSNPELAQTLRSTAQNFLLSEDSPDESSNCDNTQGDGLLEKTQVIQQPFTTQRFIGENQRYRIEKPLASGGAGIVYQAFDTVLQRKVALKELYSELAGDEEHTERFKVEARALAALTHPHVVPVYDLLEEKGHFWLVMELLTGGDLSNKIERTGTIPVNESIKVIIGLAQGLAYAHQQNFVHRDIKPANILFAADGSFRITDFGIAKHASSNVKTQQGLILGSPGYMSPEQAAGENIDYRSDIYSLGITLYHMVTGSVPFQGDTSSVLAQHITQAPPTPSDINPAISQAVEAVILKMLEKIPQNRYQSMDELVEALDALNLA